MKRLWKLPIRQRPLTDFYTFDVETAKTIKGINHWCLDGEFKYGVIYGYNYTQVIYVKNYFIQLLLSERFKDKIFFAHNADFDLSVLFNQIFELDKGAVFNGKFIRCTNGVCIFADSGNIFVGQSVKSIGKALGIQKESLGDQSYQSIGITIKDVQYCIRDCVIIYNSLLRTFQFAGDIKITQASLAMCHYRRYHQPFHIDYNENVSFFWDSYYGGRCEAFIKRKTHASVIDVNSMYPYAMRTCVFPNPKTLKVKHNVSKSVFKCLLRNYEGNVQCTIKQQTGKFGCLPYKSNNKLLFPIGTISGCWNFNEIRYALELGCEIKKIDRVVYGEKMPSPFVSYIDILSAKKIKAKHDGDEFEEMMVKYYLNMLYGKFGQRNQEETLYFKDYEKQWDEIEALQKTGEFIKLQPFSKSRKDAFVITKSKNGFHSSHSIPSFASYITSFARVILLKKMIDLEHLNVVYCDTDSIFFEINPGIQDEHHLGGWKVEPKIITEIRGLKNYKYYKTTGDEKNKEIWRVKGVPVDKGRTTKIVTDKDIIEVATVRQTGYNEFEYYNIAKTKEALRRGLNTRTIMKRKKKLKGTYDKRIVLPNGETEPIFI